MYEKNVANICKKRTILPPPPLTQTNNAGECAPPHLYMIWKEEAHSPACRCVREARQRAICSYGGWLSAV